VRIAHCVVKVYSANVEGGLVLWVSTPSDEITLKPIVRAIGWSINWGRKAKDDIYTVRLPDPQCVGSMCQYRSEPHGPADVECDWLA
jgi:hypothetical protein